MSKKEVMKLTNDWIRTKRVGGTLERTIVFIGDGGKREVVSVDIEILPATLMEQVEAALIKRDAEGHITSDEISISARQMELVRLSIGFSRKDMDIMFTHQPLNFVQKLTAECESINGQGAGLVGDDQKNVEREDGHSPDSPSSLPQESSE